jgi:hypothetical protein
VTGVTFFLFWLGANPPGSSIPPGIVVSRAKSAVVAAQITSFLWLPREREQCTFSFSFPQCHPSELGAILDDTVKMTTLRYVTRGWPPFICIFLAIPVPTHIEHHGQVKLQVLYAPLFLTSRNQTLSILPTARDRNILTMHLSLVSKRLLPSHQASNLRSTVESSASSVRPPAWHPLIRRAQQHGGSYLRTHCLAHRHLHVRKYV